MTESDAGLGVQLREQAEHAKEEGGLKLREQLDEKKGLAAAEARKFAEALRQTGSQLRAEGDGGAAVGLSSALADGIESAGTYLERAKGEDVVRDVERFARERPWMIVLGSATVGLVAARVLKASSNRRYVDGNGQRTPRGVALAEPAYSDTAGS